MRMKMFLSILLLCGLTFQSVAQSPSDLPKIIPPSPEIASLVKLGDMSAGMYTGSANVNIPLFELTAGSLKLPVALSYSTNGIRISDISSRVGLGWNLVAGGSISRVVHDEDDLDPMTVWTPAPSDLTISNGNTGLFNYLLAANTDGYDTEHDEYSFSINGISGKFYFDVTGVPHLISHSNIKIEKTGNIFILTDAAGNKYYFGENNMIEKTRGFTVNSRERWSQQSITGWFITRIVSPANDIIQFNYSPISIETLQGRTQSVILERNDPFPRSDNFCPKCDSMCLPIWQYPLTNQVNYDTKYLTGITTSSGLQAYFVHEGRGAGDLGGDNRIREIRFQHALTTPASLIKQYRLEYDTKNISGDKNQRFYLKKLYTLSTAYTLDPVIPDETLFMSFNTMNRMRYHPKILWMQIGMATTMRHKMQTFIQSRWFLQNL